MNSKEINNNGKTVRDKKNDALKWINLGFIGDKEMVGCPACHGVSETRSDFCKDCGVKLGGE